MVTKPKRSRAPRTSKADPVARARAEAAKHDAAFATSLEEAAALDFDPLAGLLAEWTPPTVAEWAALANPHQAAIAFAHRVASLSKAELVAKIASDGDTMHLALETIDNTRAWAGMIHALLDAAHARILIAASVHVRAQGEAA